MVNDNEIIINGWQILAHSQFLNQYEDLIRKVEKLKNKDPDSYKSKNDTKRLTAIFKLTHEIIPGDPTLAKYLQGDTLGENNKHWLRAKFFQQYRLFFRYHKHSKIIVYAWVNDQNTKRAYESKSDAYKVFKKMLDNDNPPGDWDELLEEAKKVQYKFKEFFSSNKH